jgi:hypothetical protein
MANFAHSDKEADNFFAKVKKVSKGSSIEEAEIEYKWLAAHATIARRCRDDKDFGFARFPYEKDRG